MSEEKRLAIPKGAVFMITSGAYSDYGVMGLFRAAEHISTEAYIAAFLKQHPDQGRHYDERLFLAWLAKSGALEQIDSFEWHLGDYASDGIEAEVIQNDTAPNYDEAVAERCRIVEAQARWEAEAPARAAEEACRKADREEFSAIFEPDGVRYVDLADDLIRSEEKE